jgi:quercetin dioxygenase-like cupin family protein
MHVTAIADARHFSLQHAVVRPLIDAADLRSDLYCFEAGQRLDDLVHPGSAAYLVLEGEALVKSAGATLRLGKGRLLRVDGGELHALENAGGGLLVMLATRAG